MRLSRREFIVTTAAAVTVRLPRFEAEPSVVGLLELQVRDARRESLAGYESALRSLGISFTLDRDTLRLATGGAITVAPIEISGIDLWAGRPHSQGIPYIDYTWPCAVKVRDFSRIVPVSEGVVIAAVDDVPVAAKRRAGSGTLIVLGSPLGPVLWAGDAEALRWLGAVLIGTRPPAARTDERISHPPPPDRRASRSR